MNTLVIDGTTLDLGAMLTRPDFDDMAAMEARCYEEDIITPAEESWNWYMRIPTSIAAAKGPDGKVAGFVNLFPVRDAIWEGIKAGAFNDADLVADDIVDVRLIEADAARDAPTLHMFFSCILVDEAWRGRGLANALVAEAVAAYERVGRLCDEVAIDTATPGGEAVARRFGFVAIGPTDHGTTVWTRDWAGFASTAANLG